MGKSKTSTKIEAHPLIAEVLARRKKGESENLVSLIGFLGGNLNKEGEVEGTEVRLYTNVKLNAYYILQTDDIAHHELVDATDKKSPHKVWLPADALVRFMVTGKAGDLKGANLSRSLAGETAGDRDTALRNMVAIGGWPGGVGT